MNENQAPEFGKLRAALWPIHGWEMKKFLPLGFLLFFILFVYTAVRDLKDAFVNKYAILGGAELVSVLKMWFVFPVAIFVVMVFSALVNKFGMKKTFYIVCSFYALFFFTFAFILFPNRDVIHMSEATMIAARASWPKLFYYFIPCIGNWSYTLFYVLSETWGTLAIGSLFWYFANEITKKTEVKRFYPLFSLVGNCGGLIAGGYVLSLSSVKDKAVFNGNVQILVCTAALFCVLTMAMHYFITKVTLSDPRFYDPAMVAPKKTKKKTGFMEGVKYLVKNPYIFLIFMLPMCYGISMNLYEQVWTAQMNQTLTDPAEFMKIKGWLSVLVSIMAFISTFVGSNVLRRCGWKVAAMLTPLLLITLGSLFFLLMFMNNAGVARLFTFSIPLFAVWIGLFIDAIGKGIKYVLFDTTKSMAYIPLNEEEKAHGQAAVESVGGRGGKASGAMLIFCLLNVISPASQILQHSYTISILFLLALVGWIVSIHKLSKRYEAKIAEQERLAAEEVNATV
jgi:AAA family ATP:ADP antiporter